MRRLRSAEAGRGYLGYNDEYMWPVGRAAGRVLQSHPELANASLQWKSVDVEGGKTVSLPESFFTVAAQQAGPSVVPETMQGEWNKVRVIGPAGMPSWNLPETNAPFQKATVRSATLQVIGSGAPFDWTAPSDGTWRVYSFNKVTGNDVNVLNQKLAKAFIGMAHQPYMDHLGADMGKSIPGAFCDAEGNYGGGNGIPWSDDLARHYQENTGRDIQLWMPLMVDDDAEGISARARADWFNAISDLYTGFHAEISDWLEQRGMYYIANLWEESLQWQTTFVGDHMKNQRGFSMPGTDCLQLKANDVHDFKEAQAVAEFEGRRLMSEIMGAAGWKDFSPVTMKECVNSVVAWGVGHVVPHGIFMTRDLDNNFLPSPSRQSGPPSPTRPIQPTTSSHRIRHHRLSR